MLSHINSNMIYGQKGETSRLAFPSHYSSNNAMSFDGSHKKKVILKKGTSSPKNASSYRSMALRSSCPLPRQRCSGGVYIGGKKYEMPNTSRSRQLPGKQGNNSLAFHFDTTGIVPAETNPSTKYSGGKPDRGNKGGGIDNVSNRVSEQLPSSVSTECSSRAIGTKTTISFPSLPPLPTPTELLCKGGKEYEGTASNNNNNTDKTPPFPHLSFPLSPVRKIGKGGGQKEDESEWFKTDIPLPPELDPTTFPVAAPLLRECSFDSLSSLVASTNVSAQTPFREYKFFSPVMEDDDAEIEAAVAALTSKTLEKKATGRIMCSSEKEEDDNEPTLDAFWGLPHYGDAASNTKGVFHDSTDYATHAGSDQFITPRTVSPVDRTCFFPSRRACVPKFTREDHSLPLPSPPSFTFPPPPSLEVNYPPGLLLTPQRLLREEKAEDAFASVGRRVSPSSSELHLNGEWYQQCSTVKMSPST